jgi:hypothetical protein
MGKRETWSLRFAYQPWPTQIGSRANFLKNYYIEGQNVNLFYGFLSVFLQNCYISETLEGPHYKELQGIFRLLILISGLGWIDQSGASIKTTFLIYLTFHRYNPTSSANYKIHCKIVL